MSDPNTVPDANVRLRGEVPLRLRDGVIRVDRAEPLPRGFVETVEQLLGKLDVRPRDEQQQRDQREEET